MVHTKASIYVNVLLPFVLVSASFSTEILSSYPLRVGFTRTPATLYNSAILLVMFMSAPAFRSVMLRMRMTQVDPVKVVFAAVLVIIVFLGDVDSQEIDRVGTVLFYGIVLSTCIAMTFRSSELPPWTAARVSVDADAVDQLPYATAQCYRMAASMILLTGTILLRKALWTCTDLQTHTKIYVRGGDSIGTGCVMCDAKAMFLLAFTSTASLVAGLIGVIRVDITRSAPAFAFSGMLQCVCVLCLYISQSQMVSRLPALFADGCFIVDQCPVAYEMRRILSSIYATGPATFLALATTILAAQLIDRSMVGRHIDAQRTRFIMVIVTATAAVGILIVFNSSQFAMSIDASIDIALLTVLIGLIAGSLVDEYLGALCVNGAIAGDFIMYYLQKIGLKVTFTYLTNVCNATCLLLFVLLSLALLVNQWVKRLPVTLQIITLLARSIAWFLAVGSISLFAVYDGSLPPTRDVADPLVARTAFSFLLWHFSPIIAWIMVSRRLPPQDLTRSMQLLCWFVAVLMVCLIYLLYLTVISGSLPSEYPLTRIAGIAVVLVFVIAPSWLCAI